MKNSILLSKLVETIELEILSTEESALIGGDAANLQTGNNCKCNGNNCNCNECGNNCKCNGNNCGCDFIKPTDPEPGIS